MSTGFAYSRTFVRIISKRTIKKTGSTTTEDRFYLSSQPSQTRTPEQWIDLTRAHWAGVENRNHWRRDATHREDAVKLRNPNATANLALLRSINLKLISDHFPDQWLPTTIENLTANPSKAFDILLNS